MSTHEVTWRSFLREPSSVERWLERGDVLLRRREGEALRLTRDSSDASRRQALSAAVRLLKGAASQATLLLDDAETTARLPWTRFLPDADRRTFVSEFLSSLGACVDLGELAALGRLVEDWKATASLYAEGLAGRLKEPIRQGGDQVRRP
jgi:hypothetical protein